MNEMPPALPGNSPLPAAYDGGSELRPMSQNYGSEPSLLVHYWRLVLRNRWPLIGIMVACLTTALLYSLLAEKQYSATARIQIEREAANLLNIEGLEGASNTWNYEFYQTQLELLESRTLSENVARELGLAEDADFLFPGMDNEAVLEQRRLLPREERLYIATQRVAAGTKITPVPGSSVFQLTYTSPDPELSARIANATAETFIATSLQRRFEATSYAREFLEERLQTTRERLEESERQAVQYAREQGLVSLDNRDGTTRALTSADLEQLSARLSAARAERIDAEADYRNNRSGSAAASALTNSAVNELRRQRGALLADLGKLENTFGPDYPQVTDLRAQIAALDTQIEREETRVTTSIDQSLGDRYRAAVAAESSLQNQVDRLKAQLLDQQQRSIGYQIIQRDVDTNRTLYEALLQRFKEVGIAGGVGLNNVSIVDAATVPRGPSSPNLILNLMLGLVAGVVLGAALLFAREQFDDAVVLPSEFDNKLGAPLLGTTPRISKSDVPGQIDRDKSALTEAYYSTLTSIQYSSNQGAPPSLLVTSTQSNEGKSTTAFALARDLAQVGKKVLLIDADMRNPSLHKVHDLPLAPGISDMLTGNASLSETLHASEHDNLSMMAAGTNPPNPAELLNGDTMRDIVRSAADEFDHVIIDGPPVLGLADAPLLARSVEGTVFVVEHGRTRATQARLAMTRLMGVQARIIGAVLTKFDAKSEGLATGYGYDYRYKGEKGDADA